jgi:hypothetical protein
VITSVPKPVRHVPNHGLNAITVSVLSLHCKRDRPTKRILRTQKSQLLMRSSNRDQRVFIVILYLLLADFFDPVAFRLLYSNDDRDSLLPVNNTFFIADPAYVFENRYRLAREKISNENHMRVARHKKLNACSAKRSTVLSVSESLLNCRVIHSVTADKSFFFFYILFVLINTSVMLINDYYYFLFSFSSF